MEEERERPTTPDREAGGAPGADSQRADLARAQVAAWEAVSDRKKRRVREPWRARAVRRVRGAAGAVSQVEALLAAWVGALAAWRVKLGARMKALAAWTMALGPRMKALVAWTIALGPRLAALAASAVAPGARVVAGAAGTVTLVVDALRSLLRSVRRGVAAAGRAAARLAGARSARNLGPDRSGALRWAAAILALALLSTLDHGIPAGGLPADSPSAAIERAAARPPGSRAAERSKPSGSRPAAGPEQPVQVQINARPWARIRIDGVDAGTTPLSLALVPGEYRIDAEFPDGRRLRRSVEIGPQQRFVALP